MKIQNKKTRTTTAIIAALMIGLVLLSPTALFPNISAQTTIDSQDVMKKLPSSSILRSEESDVISLAISDPPIQHILQGKNYKLMSADWVGEINSTYFSAYPEIHINVNNAMEITVIGDLKNHKVLRFGEFPMVKELMPKTSHQVAPLAPVAPGFAYDYYTGTTTSPNGIIMKWNNVPSYITAGNTMNYYMSFLVNALETGGGNSGCSTTGVQYDNFAQSGVLFNSTNALPNWADSSVNCNAQYPLQFSYTTGHNYNYQIYVSGGDWYEYGQDSSTNPIQYFSHPESGVAYGTFQTNNIGTGVFMENWNTSGAYSWYGYFGADPTVTSGLSTDGGVTYIIPWDKEKMVDVTCTNTYNYYSYTNQVISGNLTSTNGATWSVFNMANYMYGC